MTECPVCESSISDDDFICMSCGTKIEKVGDSSENIPIEEPLMTDTTFIPVSVEPDPLPEPEYVNSEQKQGIDFSSDCCHFKCEWNKGSSIFIADTTSSLAFKLTPLVSQARNATNFQFLLKFPDEHSFTECPIRFARLSAPREIYVNYKPASYNVGSKQAIDFYFSYELDGQTICFDQQIVIDVYSQNTPKDKILDNLTISIGDIKQDGYGGDPSLVLDVLKNSQDSGSSLNDMLDSLKKADLWTELLLFSAIPIVEENQSKKTLNIPPVPDVKYEKLTLHTRAGHRIHLLCGELALGRSRDAGVIIRNLPAPGEERMWDQQRMVHENCRISGLHFKLGVNNDKAWVVDTSSNGTYVNDRPIGQDAYTIQVQANTELSLGGPAAADPNLVLKLRVYKSYQDEAEPASAILNTISDLTTSSVKDIISGIAMTRVDDIPEAYMLINNWLPLTSVHDGLPENWSIKRKNG